MPADRPPRRATQSLIGTIHFCLRHPSLLGCELLWRWAFGIPALYLIFHQAQRIFALVPADAVGQLQAAAYDPVQAAAILSVLGQSLVPFLIEILKWLVPLLIIAWVGVSGIGRWLVLWRISQVRPELIAVPPPFNQAFRIAGFQALRVLGLTSAFMVSLLIIHSAAASAFVDPQNPNLVFLFAALIITTLATFTAWAVLSWAVTIGPLLLVREHAGFMRSAMRSIRLDRRLRNKLIEINLVLGIAKLAAIVLEMVFSAIPLPFESATTPEQLHVWWACVAVAYLVTNDFFQVARLVGMLESLEYWRPHALLHTENSAGIH